MQVYLIGGYGLGQWCSSWCNFAFQGTPVKSGVISVCEEGAGCRHPIKCPTMHRTDPTRKTYPASNISSNEVEKLCSSPTEKLQGHELHSDSGILRKEWGQSGSRRWNQQA